MSSIGSRIFLQAIKDGSQLHGTLISTDSLSQAYWAGNNGKCTPNWNGDTGPIIYLSLNDGEREVNNRVTWDDWDGHDSEHKTKWFYNGKEIAFSETVVTPSSGDIVKYRVSTGLVGDSSSDESKFVKDKFRKIQYSFRTYSGSTPILVPGFQIVKNLGDGTNVDNDVIGFLGYYQEEMSNTKIPIQLSVNVVITELTNAGVFCALRPATLVSNTTTPFTLNSGGDIVINHDTDQVWLYPQVFKEGVEYNYFGNNDTPQWNVTWWLNSIDAIPAYTDPFAGDVIPSHGYISAATVHVTSDNGTKTTKIYPVVAITRDTITDYGIVEARVFDSHTEEYISSGFQEVDDRLDDEMMYISLVCGEVTEGTVSESGEGASGYLRHDDVAVIESWIATQEDRSSYKRSYHYWYLWFLDNKEREYVEDMHWEVGETKPTHYVKNAICFSQEANGVTIKGTANYISGTTDFSPDGKYGHYENGQIGLVRNNPRPYRYNGSTWVAQADASENDVYIIDNSKYEEDKLGINTHGYKWDPSTGKWVDIGTKSIRKMDTLPDNDNTPLAERYSGAVTITYNNVKQIGGKVNAYIMARTDQLVEPTTA